MKTPISRSGSLLLSVITAVAAFVLISVFAGGVMEFSREAGFWVWLRDLLAYNFTNKIAQKLFASLALGGTAYFVSRMIAYGQLVSAQKRARSHRKVSFYGEDDRQVGRTA